MQVVNGYAFNAATNATANSDPIKAEFMTSMSAQVWFTDNTAAGTLKVQVSDDPKKGTPSHWNDLSGVSVTVASGATSHIPKFDTCYQWIRFVWTRTGGAGTFTCRFKGLEHV